MKGDDLGLRFSKLAGDRIIDHTLETLTNSLSQWFKLQRDPAMGFAYNPATMVNIQNGITDFEFQGEVEHLTGTKQAVISGELQSTKTPVLDRKGVTIDNNHTTITRPARMTAAGGYGIVAGTGF